MNSVLLDIEFFEGPGAPEPSTGTGQNRGPYVLGEGGRSHDYKMAAGEPLVRE